MTTTLNERILRLWSSSSAPAILTSDGAWSGREFIARAWAAAQWLDELELPAGALVPALLVESPDALALAVGAALSGRALAPLGTRLPVDQLALAVRTLGAEVIVTEPAYAVLAGDVARRLDGQAPAGGPEVGRSLAGRGGRAPRARAVLCPAFEPVSAASVAAARGDAATIGAVIHTSGTTGQPRPVLMRHDALVARSEIYRSAIELGVGDRYCSASPFFHVAGMGMALVALGLGATVIPCPGFSVEEWGRLGRLEPTHALLVPTMIDMLLAEGAFDAKVRVLQYGAAPIHPLTLAAAIKAAPDTRLIQIFGQTEVSPITVLTHADHVRAAAGEKRLLESVGRPPDGVELRIENVGPDGVGEITVRAGHVFSKDPDGWRRSGDLGLVDEEGYVFLLGRRDDRIVRGGENIFPLEVETVLARHPAVAEVCVVGAPDQRWGEVVKAVVVVAVASSPPTLAELQTFAREHMAPFKAPTIVEFAETLPRTPTGKVLRRLLR